LFQVFFRVAPNLLLGLRLSLSTRTLSEGAKTVVPSEDYSHGPP